MKYDLEAVINVSSSEIVGTARIEVISGEELLLNTGSLALDSIKLDNKEIDFDQNGIFIKIIPEKSGILEIKFRGIFRANRFSSEKNDQTVFNVIDNVGVSLTNTWYPQVEGLRYYSLKATLPKGYEAVSEAEEINKVKKEDATEFHFHFQHPLDSINLTASNRYVVSKDSFNGIEIYSYFFPEDASLADTYIQFTKKYLQLYEDLIGKFPYKRFSIVENILPTGYSFPTFTLLGSSVVKLPFIVETSLGHEILHQWFGNNVYVDYKLGNWAEGLTTYLADHLYEEQSGRGWEYRKKILTDYISYVTPENEIPLKNFMGRVDLSSRAIGYGKTAMVFHMLRNLLGEKMFFGSLKDVIKENRFRKASWEELKLSFEKNYGQDLTWFFVQWIGEAGLPEMEIQDLKLIPEGSGYAFHFSVMQKENFYKFMLPVSIYVNNAVVRKTFFIEKEREDLKLILPDKPEKVVLDEDYDTARLLDRKEFPAVVARLLGEQNLIIASPLDSPEKYQAIIDIFLEKGAVNKGGHHITNSEIMSSSIVILGHDNPVVSKIFGKLPYEDAGFSLIMKENPFDTQKVIVIINGKSKMDVDTAAGKISHYGKYSKLLFEEGRNTAKEIEQTERGIIMYMDEEPQAVDVSAVKRMSEIMDSLTDKKIVYVGEVHDLYTHHAVQLDIIRALHRKNKKIAIGMEMFQRPFQPALDSFIAGEIDEADFLKKSEYFKRWGFDYNLYKPILDFARAEKVPVIALNLQREFIEKVSREGIDSLSEEEKGNIPTDMDFSDNAYRERLKNIFGQHKNSEKKNFNNFYQAQLLWDETMSWSIDEFLDKNPDHQVVVIVGKGHLEFGSGIPQRAFRRNGKSYAIVLVDTAVEKGIADFVIFPKNVEGITSPKLMVFISEEKEGVKITSFPEMSITEKAGVKAGDIIISLDGISMKSLDDIKIFLLYKKLGDTVKMGILRKEAEQESRLEFDVVL